MNYLKALNPVLLFFFSAGTIYADCAVLTPEEAEYYFRQDLINLALKALLLGATLVSLILGALRLFRSRIGKVFFALLCLAVIPIALGYLFIEIMAGECGIGGIGAEYYVVPTLASIVLYLAAIFFTRDAV